jgi:hypothetical protein
MSAGGPQDYVCRDFLDLRILGIERALCGADQQADDQRIAMMAMFIRCS